MPKPIEIEYGTRFGSLRVICRIYGDHLKEKTYACKCECGKIHIVASWNLRRPKRGIRSCGCIHGVVRNPKHGHARVNKVHPLYFQWCLMRNRCYSKQSAGYQWCGARGIRVCERWLHFANFLADVGERPPGTRLRRLDTSKDYCPENCRWIPIGSKIHDHADTPAQ